MLKKIGYLFIAAGIALAGAALATTVHAQENTRLAGEADVLAAFGGKEGLVRIMDDFMVNLVKDPRTKPFFENSDQKRVKEKLVEQFCFILNGPCDYKGGAMKPMHANLGINRDQFNALVEQLQLAMDKHNVPFRAQNKLLSVLAPMHRDIITR